MGSTGMLVAKAIINGEVAQRDDIEKRAVC